MERTGWGGVGVRNGNGFAGMGKQQRRGQRRFLCSAVRYELWAVGCFVLGLGRAFSIPAVSDQLSAVSEGKSNAFRGRLSAVSYGL